MSSGLAQVGKSRKQREKESFEPFGIEQLKHSGGLEKSRAVFQSSGNFQVYKRRMQ